MRRRLILGGALFVLASVGFGRGLSAQKEQSTPDEKLRITGPARELLLPKPVTNPKPAKRIRLIPKPEGWVPAAPAGFRVTALGDTLDNPRMPYALPNGDLLVVETIANRRGQGAAERIPANRITLLRDTNRDGRADLREAFLTGLNQPFGVTLIGKYLYVGNNDSLVRYVYQPGQTRISAPGEKILDLPEGGSHYTRNLLAKADGSKIYVAIGSATGNGEGDPFPTDRAAIWEVNPDGSGKRIFATGLRNPTGIDWEPTTRVLWTVVNERGGMGDDTPPDYLTSVRDGGFYGFPFYYWGFWDTRVKETHPDMRTTLQTPDYSIGPHCAPTGLVFSTGSAFPQQYRGGAFVSCHGSTLRSILFGYGVFYVRFVKGQAVDDPQDFLTGFIANPETGDIYGRPVGVSIGKDGSLLVADDAGNTVWQVTYTGAGATR